MPTVDSNSELRPDEELINDIDSSIGDVRLPGYPPTRCEILIGLDAGQCIFNRKYFQFYLELPTGKWEDLPSVQGRKYAKLTHYNFTLDFGLIDTEYHLPNDQIENERLDLQHHLFLLTFENKLGLAPPNSPEATAQRVLDVGTGTGIWAIDYADEHPQAEVTGVDLSPIQPDFVPPNVRFIIDDIDEEWNYADLFDYIHSRMMMFSIKNWEIYIQKIFKNLAPGGFVEIQEISGTIYSDDKSLKQDHALSKWCRLLGEAFTKLGSHSIAFEKIKTIMTEVGFTDIVDTRFKWPTNPWPKEKKHKELGAWNNVNNSGALESLTLASFSRAHGWTRDEITMFLMDVRKDLNNPTIHAYNPICAIYAKKPEN